MRKQIKNKPTHNLLSGLIWIGLLTGMISLFSPPALSFLLHAEEMDFHAHFQKRVTELYPEAVKIRRQLHRIPEPCFNEKKTAAFVADYLQKCGLEVQTGLAGTGVKAILRGGKFVKGVSPVVGIRSDMDALPITEETGFDFQSENKGYMHACGHDGHMTNVLITAKLLSEVKDDLAGTVVFIFQPCEEGAPGGGASGSVRMIEAGALQNPTIDYMLGLHVMPGYPVGTVAFCEGPIMANVGSVYITIHGKSSHGAFPHQGCDAIYAAGCAIQEFQSLVSRRRDPGEVAVFSIGKICGGVRLNVIADKVDMEGTVRTFSFETESMIEKGIDDILKGLKVSQGISYDYRFVKTSRFVKNDSALEGLLDPVFRRILGNENVHTTEPMTIGEDFAMYSHEVPSFFFFLGSGEEGKLHTPTYAVDEGIFKYGPVLFSTSAVELMKRKK